ncbi:MATE family efflux transporter [Gayadomonas joobiniege]|uniref:MATE family efflux transporter n=1 Tax=Gayadomonas joobiniege TaxID=1234606 RepID=UPI00037D8F2D|nr:MATE family efflux transporter [Gayadomonas joobiniege]
MLSGRYIKEIFKLAWPIWITQAIQTLMVTIDLLMSAQVSENDMAAVGTALSIWHLVYFFSLGVIMVLSPILSRHYGRSDYPALAKDLMQGVWLALFICLISTAALLFSTGFLEYLGLDAPLVRIGSEYLQYLAYGIPFICLMAVLRFLNEAVGQTKPLMIISSTGMAINVALNYLFIYGSPITPALGGAGCGVATSLVNLYILIAMWFYSNRAAYTKPIIDQLSFAWPNFSTLLHQLKLGLPIGLTILMEIALFAAVALAIATYGTAAAAAHQIALNVTTNFYMIPLSIGMATTVLVGQRIGQQKFKEAKKVSQSAITMSLIFAAFSCTTIYFTRPYFIPLFTDQAEIIVLAGTLLMWAAVFQFPDALQTVFASALRAYADTRFPMLMVLIAYWCVGFPFGYFVAQNGIGDYQPGVAAYWQGLLISLSAAAILLYIRLRIFYKKSSDLL